MTPTPDPDAELIEVVNQLMAPPDPPKRPIGFVTPEDKSKKTSAKSKG